MGLDYVGAALSIGMVTCLLIPLQWGGNEKPWSDRSVIALLIVVSFSSSSATTYKLRCIQVCRALYHVPFLGTSARLERDSSIEHAHDRRYAGRLP